MVLDAIKGLLTGGPAYIEVRRLFDSLEGGPVEILTDYVVRGRNPEALTTLSAQVRSSLYYGFSASRRQAMEHLNHDPSKLSPEQWVRLGQVYSLGAASNSHSSDWPKEVPTWLMALQYERQRYSSDITWEPAFLHQVLAAAGVTAEQCPRIILSAFFADFLHANSYANPASKWRKHVDEPHARAFAAYLWDNISLVPPAVRTLPAAARSQIAAWLELYPALLPPLAPLLAEWAVGSAKTVREAAVKLIILLPDPVRWQTLTYCLDAPANLDTLIAAVARMGPYGWQLLDQALAQGKGGKRDELLAAAINRNQAATTPEVLISIPPAPPLDMAPLGTEFNARFLTTVDRWRESLEKSVAMKSREWERLHLAVARSIGPWEAEEVRRWLSGQGRRPSFADNIPEQLLFANLDLPLLPALRATMGTRRYRNNRITLDWNTVDNLHGKGYDFRALEQAARIVGIKDPVTAVGVIAFGWDGLRGRAADNVWPFYAEHPQFLDSALGLIPELPEIHNQWLSNETTIALRVLEMFPELPTRYVTVVAEIATGTKKTNRREAQELLERHPHVVAIAEQSMGSGKSEVRSATAAWIGRIGRPEGVDILLNALDKEKREQPRAAILTALTRLGSDISTYLTPESLAREADRGLTSKPPSGMEWFPMDALPTCRWADGATVEAKTIRWWVTLGVKMKDPTGAGLLPQYVSLLDQPSRETLGRFVLDSWIAHDTQHPSDEECRAHAASLVDARYKGYQADAKRSPNFPFYAAKGAMTKDQVFNELLREKGREYVGSALGSKGMLALISGAPGREIYATIQRYIRDSIERRAQVEALITAASTSPDPAAIQLVLSIARKYKQESIRLKAVELSEEIAEQRGWTLDELADRTIPTAGFDDDGILELPFGERTFTGRVSRSPKTGAFTIDVFNPDGKPIKALPKPAMADDEGLAGQSRKQLTASKKELGQVVTLQTGRLFEAMCMGRVWDAQSWSEFFLDHPLMRHLVSTLVWKTWAQIEGEASTHNLYMPYTLVRPTVDGELLTVDDDTATLSEASVVCIAHQMAVSDEEAALWKKHLADYGIRPPFSQFGAVIPPILEGQSTIDDHQGWLSDSFAIRGRAIKRGYQRGSAEDGGWFGEYFKNMPGSGIRICVSFTGSFLPEEQIPASITTLTFEKDGHTLSLEEVSPILLAESYADYVHIAEAGVFDPDWQAKSEF